MRSYCRSFPATFTSASGAVLTADDGRRYLDFLAGAGALNFGHNHPAIVAKVVEYLTSGGILQALDLHTTAKADLLHTIDELLLRPGTSPTRCSSPAPPAPTPWRPL